jgi:hypothetical protein
MNGKKTLKKQSPDSAEVTGYDILSGKNVQDLK